MPEVSTHLPHQSGNPEETMVYNEVSSSQPTPLMFPYRGGDNSCQKREARVWLSNWA